ncbi:MAG: transglutaminase domain-containing protein [bacterium]
MAKKFVFIFSVILCIQSVVFSAEIHDKFVSGTHTVEYFIRDPENLLIPVTVNTIGYSQQVQRIHRGYFVTVTSTVQPIPNAPFFKFDADNLDPRFKDAHLLKALTEAKNTSDALRACLSWLDMAVIYDDSLDSDQDIDATLARKSGNCVGRTAVLQKLLNELGLQSRPVQGCLFQNGKLVFHRWIELDYDGIGSLPTTPGSTQDFVSADHLVLLPSKKIDPSATWVDDDDFSISVINENRSLFVIDCRPTPEGAVNQVFRRKMDNLRLETAVTGDITPTGLQGHIVLETPGGVHSMPIPSHGAFSFIPVSPGHYSLTIKIDGREVFFTQDAIRASEHKHHHCIVKIGSYGLNERTK